jgi:hypothetical protein
MTWGLGGATYEHAVGDDGDASTVEGVHHELAVQVLVPTTHKTHRQKRGGGGVRGAGNAHVSPSIWQHEIYNIYIYVHMCV